MEKVLATFQFGDEELSKDIQNVPREKDAIYLPELFSDPLFVFSVIWHGVELDQVTIKLTELRRTQL